MTEINQAAQKDRQAEQFGRWMSGIVGCVVVTIGGFFAYSNRDSLKVDVPDRNKMWADAWKKKLSDKSGVPEFKGSVVGNFEGVKLDPAMLQPQFNMDQFRSQAGTSSSSSSRSSSTNRSSRRSR